MMSMCLGMLYQADVLGLYTFSCLPYLVIVDSHVVPAVCSVMAG